MRWKSALVAAALLSTTNVLIEQPVHRVRADDVSPLTMVVGHHRGAVGQSVDISGRPCRGGEAPIVGWTGMLDDPPNPPTSRPVPVELVIESGGPLFEIWRGTLVWQPEPILVTATSAGDPAAVSTVLAPMGVVGGAAAATSVQPAVAEITVSGAIAGASYVAVAGEPDGVVGRATASSSTLRMQVPAGVGPIWVLGLGLYLQEFPVPMQWEAPAVAATEPFPLIPADERLELRGPAYLNSISADGRFAIVNSPGAGVNHWSLPTQHAPSATPPGLYLAEPGGVFAYRSMPFYPDLTEVDRATVKRWRVGTDEVTTFAPPFTDPDWYVERVTAVDPSGRFLALNVVGGRNGRVTPFLYDAVTGEVSAPFGEWWAAVDPGPLISSISRDGQLIRGVQFTAVVETVATYWQLDLATGVRSDLFQVQADARVSSNQQWSVFVSNRGPDARSGFRPSSSVALYGAYSLYRRNEATGIVVRVPVEVAAVDEFDVADDGRVLISHAVPTPGHPTARHPSDLQLSMWFGDGVLVPITVGTDGRLANAGVAPWTIKPNLSDDGRRVSFYSEATNLGTTPDGPRNPLLYQVVLPPPAPDPGPASQLLPDESVCIAAVNASPGDFVAVNVTPVNAIRGGHGLMHSSDDRPGSVSNVNFAAGTIDPNVTMAQVGVDGEVCVANSTHGPVDVVLDQMATFSGTALRSPTNGLGAVRLVDTRVGFGGGKVAPSERRCTFVSNATPGDHVGVNVTPVEASTAGDGLLHSSDYVHGFGREQSTVNFGLGTVSPNFAIAVVGSNGQICFTNSRHGSIHLVLDQLMVGSAAAFRTPVTWPSRLVDTRRLIGGTRLAPSETRCFLVDEAVPGEYFGANLTPVGAATHGFATLHSSDDPSGDTSSVNFAPGSVAPNLAIAKVGSDGRVCVTNSYHGSVEMIVDAQILASVSTVRADTAGSVRLVDTRESWPF